MPKIGVLESLTTEQKEQVLAWLELYSKREVLEKLAAPPPEGFDVRTHPACLRRFEQRFHLSNKSEDLALARGLLHASEDLDLLKRSTGSSLAQAAFNLATSLDPGRVAAAAKLLAALKRDDFREQDLLLARERLALERDHRREQNQIRQRELELDQARLELERQKIAALLAVKDSNRGNDSSPQLDQQLEDEIKRAYAENLAQ